MWVDPHTDTAVAAIGELCAQRTAWDALDRPPGKMTIRGGSSRGFGSLEFHERRVVNTGPTVDHVSTIPVAIDVTGPDADGVISLLTYAVGSEERDRLDVALVPYRTGSAVLAVARTLRLPVGVIGYRTAPDQLTPLHLATDPHRRHHGIGNALIHWVHARHPSLPLVAETDTGAVRFYEKTGFTSTSLGEKYPGVERFLVRRPPSI